MEARKAKVVVGLVLGAVGFTLFLSEGRLVGALVGLLAAAQSIAYLFTKQ